jgi:O-antigen ligase
VLSDGTPIISAENLFLQIFLELGIVGFVLFIFMLFAFGQKCFISANAKNVKSRSRTIICAGYTSIVTACVMGLDQYIWLNYRNFLAFWIILALTVALTKVNEKEAESGKVMNSMRSVDIQLG